MSTTLPPLDMESIKKSVLLPSLPAVAVQLLEMSRDPETSLQEIANLLKTDPALSVKLLKTANSSYYGFRSEVSSIDRAVPLMGRTVVMSIALSFVLYDQSRCDDDTGGHFQRYWRQSIVQAVAAEEVADKMGVTSDGSFFQTALLCDIGRLVLLRTASDRYTPLLNIEGETPELICDVEEQFLGLNHSSVGSALMEDWGISGSMCRAARHHHFTPEQLTDLGSGEEADLSRITALATSIGDYWCSPAPGAARQRMLSLFGELLEMREEEVDEFLENVRGRVEEASEVFKFDVNELPEPSQLMADAIAQLAQIAMDEAANSTRVLAEKMELEFQNRTLVEQTITDPLTGVSNRRHFEEVLTKEVSRCRRYGRPVGVVFMDIDHFKSLNDTYGHAFGDEVLVEVARTIEKTLRDTDTLSRFGGEEFVGMIVEPTESGLSKVAERIRENVSAIDVRYDDRPVALTISVGATLSIPPATDDQIVQRLIETADRAMYSAKANGRNRVVFERMMSDQQRRVYQRATSFRFSRWLVREGHLDRIVAFKLVQGLTADLVTVEQVATQLGFLTGEQLQEIQQLQVSSGDWLGAIAVDREMLTEDQLVTILAIQQEEPRDVARMMISQNLVDTDQAKLLLAKYFNVLFPEGRVPGRVDATRSAPTVAEPIGIE